MCKKGWSRFCSMFSHKQWNWGSHENLEMDLGFQWLFNMLNVLSLGYSMFFYKINSLCKGLSDDQVSKMRGGKWCMREKYWKI
jgi:hypothetical protein